jgi:hypothetical protein
VRGTWRQIAGSPLLSIYAHELYWLARDVVSRADAVFERTPTPAPGEGYIHSAPELHADIYALLGSAAKIRALISERPKRRNQSTRAYEVLRDRVRALAAILDGLEIETIHSPDVRHSLEHFDERIDQTAEALVQGSTPLPAFLPFDMAIWARTTLNVLRTPRWPDPEFVLLRVYIASERCFVNAGHEIDIGRLHQEASTIVERIEPMLGEVKEGRGASIIVVTEQSFGD